MAGRPLDRVAWVDATAGIAGDMLLGALVDAGAPLAALQGAVDAVLPGAVRLRASPVTRASLRATKVDVDVLVDDPPHRTWRTIQDLFAAADLPATVREGATATFARLAAAEGRVHGIDAGDVHFHEVGALDSVADVVGTCAALHALGVGRLVGSPVAVGSGTVTAQHGTLPVPAPAVLELAGGWEVLAGGTGELATPTGMALLTALAQGPGPLPPMAVDRTGVGAGTRDRPGRANVVRVVVGTPAVPASAGQDGEGQDGEGQDDGARGAVLLETNVDDLDPRLWPEVLGHLMSAGALDAWLTPILMKKGRPAHTLHVLAEPGLAGVLGAAVLAHTSTLGLRRTGVSRDVLERSWTPVAVDGAAVRIKVGHREGRIVQAMPEFADVVALAAARAEPVAAALQLAQAAAVTAGLSAGRPWPPPT